MEWKNYEDNHRETVEASEAEQDGYYIRCAIHISGGIAIKFFIEDDEIASCGLFIDDGTIWEAQEVAEELFDRIKGRDLITRSKGES